MGRERIVAILIGTIRVLRRCSNHDILTDTLSPSGDYENIPGSSSVPLSQSLPTCSIIRDLVACIAKSNARHAQVQYISDL